MTLENNLLRRAAVAERDKAKNKEVDALNESLRLRALAQLKANGQDVSGRRFHGEEAVQFAFSNFVKIQLGDESVRVNFELGADYVDLDSAVGISIRLPILNEKLLLEKKRARDRGIGNYDAPDEPTEGNIVTTTLERVPFSQGGVQTREVKVLATYNQLEHYTGLLNLIEAKFPLPQSTADEAGQDAATNTP